MSTILAGNLVRLSSPVTDINGTLVDPTTISVSVRDPNNTIATYTTATNPPVVRAGVGDYYIDLTPTTVGHYLVVWQTTGNGQAVATDEFDIADPFGNQPLLTLDDVKAQLNITDTTSDVELQTYIDATVGIIEGLCGPVVGTTVTETIEGTQRRGMLVLGKAPVVAVTSVSSAIAGNTTVYDSDTWLLDSAAGILRTNDYSVFSLPVTVTYTTGRSSVPAAMNLAARIILAHLWQTQYGGGDFQLLDEGQASGVSSTPGYAIPNRALELLAPYRLAPSIA